LGRSDNVGSNYGKNRRNRAPATRTGGGAGGGDLQRPDSEGGRGGRPQVPGRAGNPQTEFVGGRFRTRFFQPGGPGKTCLGGNRGKPRGRSEGGTFSPWAWSLGFPKNSVRAPDTIRGGAGPVVPRKLTGGPGPIFETGFRKGVKRDRERIRRRNGTQRLRGGRPTGGRGGTPGTEGAKTSGNPFFAGGDFGVQTPVSTLGQQRGGAPRFNRGTRAHYPRGNGVQGFCSLLQPSGLTRDQRGRPGDRGKFFFNPGAQGTGSPHLLWPVP